MTKLRKFVSLLVVTIMVFAMSINVFADPGTASVTITNTTKDEVYEIYKIFDAVVDDDKESYYIAASEEAIIDSAKGFKVDDKNVFTLEKEGTDKYRVYFNGSDAEVLAWVKAAIDDSMFTRVAYETSDGTDVVFSGLSLGYYYVTTQTSTLLILKDVNENIIVSDKRTAPSWDPSDPSSSDPANGKFIKDTDGTVWTNETDAAIADIQYFMVNAYVPKTNGLMTIYEYTITDTLDEGFTNISDVTATIKDGQGNLITTLKSTDADPKIVVEDNKITVKYVVSDIDDYPTDAHISITYSAVVDNDAVIYDPNPEESDKVVSNRNIATLEWTEYDSSKGEPTPDPTDPDNNVPGEPDDGFPPDVQTDTYVFGFNLKKVETGKDEVLDGAEFNLLDPSGNPIKFVKSDNTYKVSNATTASEVIEAGEVTIEGLDSFTYSLVETKAPAGYNKLAAPVSVSALDDDAKIALSDNNVTVENSKGITLPTTGGIGTRIFYITGATIMLGAVVVLVAKKRTSNNK